ncbi:endoplasmic reticulum membrane sensor NFE2L1a isoform X2 [Synchiropus splendidus]|uniref:endoplasmic reticulum membrane sensor NFE2L1a isoform X2 n=1 Tax=Synchiropus splendidus TaxID=270530 RepID=UPI00237EBC55|nr:endoplasmic reticulum membrane sensor NFE2L1a isoform X2 [Synchiropus splendidus]
MLSLKKYFTDSLMQMAILLSLCGVRVDVGLESYLHEMILGPTSLLTHTPFHNFCNRLAGGQGLHPKSVDLDRYFWTQTLLSWICSPDRLQIPQQEVVSWLVQQEPDPAFPEQTTHTSRGVAATERNQSLWVAGDQDVEEEMQNEESSVSNQQRAVGEEYVRRDGGESAVAHAQSNQEEVNQSSLLECFRLLEVTFPLSQEVEFQDVAAEEDMDKGPTERYHGPITHIDSSTSEMDLQWQDLLTILTPQNIPASFGLDSGDPLFSHGEAPGTQGLERELESGLLPLIPSAQLDDHSSSCDRQHSRPSRTDTPPDHSGLLSVDLGLSLEDSFNSFDMHLLPGELHENVDPAFTSALQPDSSLSSSSSPSCALDVEDEAEFDELLQEAAVLGEMEFLDLALEEGFSSEMKDDVLSQSSATHEQRLASGPQQEAESEVDSDSGLSLDFSYSPSSPCVSSISTSSPSTSEGGVSNGDNGSEVGFDSPDMEAGVTIKQEQEEEELGAEVSHDHTYHQPWRPSSPIKPSRSTRSHVHRKLPFSRRHSDSEMRSRDERRARALKIPFSNELIVHLPVEEFNDLLAEYQLTEDQLTMVRDIRRRGKNKIAAQNCRQRKLGVLRGLEVEVSALRHRRLRLLRERQEALRSLKEMKRELRTLYWEVSSSLRDELGRPLDSTQFQIHVGPDATVGVESHTHEQSSAFGKTRKKRREKRT